MGFFKKCFGPFFTEEIKKNMTFKKRRNTRGGAVSEATDADTAFLGDF